MFILQVGFEGLFT